MNNKLPARPAPAIELGDSLMRMLADPNITAEKMSVLLNMQKEIMAERRREAFQAAFAAMSAEMPQVDKNGIVELIKDGKSFGRYNFAKWEDMDTVIRPIMHRHGFALTFPTRIDGGKTIMVGTLMHAAGHCETSERVVLPDPGPGRNSAQAEGSGLTYAKRYCAEGLLNIVRKGVDDDAIKAGLLPISEAQTKQLTELLTDTKTNEETFLRRLVTGVEKLADVPAREFPRLKNALEEKKRSLLKSAKEIPEKK